MESRHVTSRPSSNDAFTDRQLTGALNAIWLCDLSENEIQLLAAAVRPKVESLLRDSQIDKRDQSPFSREDCDGLTMKVLRGLAATGLERTATSQQE